MPEQLFASRDHPGAAHPPAGGERGPLSRSEMLSQIVDPDFVLLAARAPGDELAGRSAQRLLGIQEVRGGAHLVAHYGVDLWVVAVELGKFRGDVAGGDDGAGAERVLDRD